MKAVFLGIVAGMGLSMGAMAQDSQETLKAQVVATKPDAAAATAPATGTGRSFANTVCTNGKNKRSVELTPGDAATKAPCTVHYKKETEQPGHDQVLWNSAKDLTYCQAKAQAFVEKLSGWGWTCAKQ